MRGFKSSRKALAYGAVSFSSAAMHNIFITYYVHFFLETFKIDDGWFYFGQIVFMIWNSFNDPWFGWLLDQYEHKNKTKNRVLSRVPIIRYGGVIWCAGFLFVYTPLSNGSFYTGFHFILSLCIYDGMLSLVLLAHGSLIADIATSAEERAECNMWNSTFSLIGSGSVLLSQLVWDKHHIENFQFFCVILSIICCASFLYTSIILETEFKNKPSTTQENENPVEAQKDVKEQKSEYPNPRKNPPIKEFFNQLLRVRNFWVYTIVNLIQVFNCHFNSNFISICMEQLLIVGQHTISPRQLSAFVLTSSSLFPHLLVILLTPVQKKYGLYLVIQYLFYFKLFFALAIFIFGSAHHWYLIVLFIFVNKSFSESICRHGGLVLANIVDEDQVINKREQTASAMIFGVNALFTKPGQSFAPMLGWTILYMNNFREAVNPDSLLQSEDQSFDPNKSTINEIVFGMLCLVPACCAALQLLLWFKFTLKGNYLQNIKESVTKGYHLV